MSSGTRAPGAGLSVRRAARADFPYRWNDDPMDSAPALFGLMAAILLACAWHAHRLGNERRDVVFLGVTSGLLGLGAGVSALV